MVIFYFCTILPHYFCTILQFYYATSALLESLFCAVLKKSAHFCESFSNFCVRRNYITFLHEKQASFREDFARIYTISVLPGENRVQDAPYSKPSTFACLRLRHNLSLSAANFRCSSVMLLSLGGRTLTHF